MYSVMCERPGPAERASLLGGEPAPLSSLSTGVWMGGISLLRGVHGWGYRWPGPPLRNRCSWRQSFEFYFITEVSVINPSGQKYFLTDSPENAGWMGLLLPFPHFSALGGGKEY